MADKRSKEPRNVALGRRIAELRKMRGIHSQKDFAARLGMSEGSISRYEAGYDLIDRDKLRQIANVLGVNYDELAHIVGYVQEKPAEDEIMAEWEKWEADLEALLRRGRNLFHRRAPGG